MENRGPNPHIFRATFMVHFLRLFIIIFIEENRIRIHVEEEEEKDFVLASETCTFATLWSLLIKPALSKPCVGNVSGFVFL